MNTNLANNDIPYDGKIANTRVRNENMKLINRLAKRLSYGFEG